MSTRTLRRTLSAAAALAIAATLAGPAPANAANNGFVATPNGMVGVQQSILVSAPAAAGQTASVTAALGAFTQTLPLAVGANGFGSVAWTPGGAGTWTITAGGAATAAGATRISVLAMPTTTDLILPSEAVAGVQAHPLVSVNAELGTLAPQGTVSITSAWNPAAISTAVLTNTSIPTLSTATLQWTPARNESYMPIKATYLPSSGGQLTSQSGWHSTLLVGSATVALRLPQVIRVDEPATIQAVLGAGMPDGSVAFSVGTQAFSGSQRTVNGVSTFSFRPTVQGNAVIKVEFSSGQNFSGVATQAVYIEPQLPKDGISVQPAGQAAWVDTAPPMQAGRSITLSAATTSGAPVLFSVAGPCAINGAGLTALGVGQCTITATTPGNTSYDDNTASFSLTVTKAPAKKPAKKPAKHKKR